MKRSEAAAEADPLANDLLRTLSAAERRVVCEHARVVAFSAGDVLFEDGEPPNLAYFPLTATVSTLAFMRDGREMEYGSIGREGMIGLQAALGAQPLRGRGLCQLGGDVLSIPAKELRVPGRAPELHRLLMRYAQSTINVLAQSAACNTLHSLRERTARWLLMSCDRAGATHFHLTQEFLARMLGARRSGVTKVAGALRRDSVIEYKRGELRVLDRAALANASCECYDVIRAEYARVLEPASIRAPRPAKRKATRG